MIGGKRIRDSGHLTTLVPPKTGDCFRTNIQSVMRTRATTTFPRLCGLRLASKYSIPTNNRNIGHKGNNHTSNHYEFKVG
jgi:hypothetical protein